jgi:hypothetical protein
MKEQGREAARAALRHLTGGTVAALVLFHGWLVARRLSDPATLPPSVLFRWLGAFAVVAALLWLRRLGLPLFHGRKALAVWTVALLLHVNAGAAPLAGDATSGSAPETLVLVLPGALSVATASALLLLATVRKHPLPASARRASLFHPPAGAKHLAPCLCGQGPRGPPVFS